MIQTVCHIRLLLVEDNWATGYWLLGSDIVIVLGAVILASIGMHRDAGVCSPINHNEPHVLKVSIFDFW